MNRLPTPHRLLPGSLCLGLLALAACGDSDQSAQTNANLYTVGKRTLPITVKENAELQALRETVVRSQLEGQATIIYLIEEGRIVETDELLARLDISDLEDKRANQKISVGKAEALKTQAEKNLDILEKELTTKRNTAVSNLQIAQMELQKFLGRPAGKQANRDRGTNTDMVTRLIELVEEAAPVAEAGANPTASGNVEAAADKGSPQPIVAHIDPGRYRPLVDKVKDLLRERQTEGAGGDVVPSDPLGYDMGDMANQVLQQVDQIRLAMADLKYQETYYNNSKRLAAKNFITPNELEKDKIEFERRLSKVGLAWNDLDLLVSYELFKNKIKLEQDVENAKLELERVDASNDAERLRASTDLQQKVEEYNLAKERLDNLEKQIKNSEIRAPTPGLVIYARLERDRRGGESIREGVQVRERQDLIILPDTTKMQAIVKVQEAVVAQIRVGQRAHVVVEAYPDRVFTGRVTRVAQQADSNGGWMSSDRKVYTTVVEIDGDNSNGELKSRMAAAVTILVDELSDVLTVPLQAVRRDRAVNYVWKHTAQGHVATPVDVGRHNAEHVVIREGIAAGDKVYLAPPQGAQPPNLPQPEVPMPELAPVEPAKPEAAPGDPAGNRGEGNGPVGAGPGGENGPGGREGGPGGRQGRPGGGMSRKPLAEMTPEELEDFKANGLAFYPRMIEGMRTRGDEAGAAAMEAKVGEIEKALAANDLETAQSLLTEIRASMRSMGGRNRGGEGGGRRGMNGEGGGMPGERGNGGN